MEGVSKCLGSCGLTRMPLPGACDVRHASRLDGSRRQDGRLARDDRLALPCSPCPHRHASALLPAEQLVYDAIAHVSSISWGWYVDPRGSLFNSFLFFLFFFSAAHDAPSRYQPRDLTKSGGAHAWLDCVPEVIMYRCTTRSRSVALARTT